MSKLERFCPSCGSTKGPFVKGFCINCFERKKELVSIPAELKIDFCRNCAMIRLHGKWVNQDESLLKKSVESFVKISPCFEKSVITVELEPEDQDQTIAHVTVNGLVDGQMIVEKRDVLLKPNYSSCERCSKISGHYHEAIIQGRGNPPSSAIEEFRNFFERYLEKDSFSVIVGIEEKKQGFDLLVGSKRAAKHAVEFVSSRYGAEVKTSSKLIGEDKSGKKKYRFTFSVRF